MEVLNSLITILIIVTLGISSRKTKLLEKEHVKILSSFVYYYGLPALFFTQITALDLKSLDLHLITISITPILGVIFLLFLLKNIGVIGKDTFTIYSLSVSFGSYAFFGIAFFESLYDGKWLPQAIITTSALGLIGIPLSIGLFEYATQEEKGGSFLKKIFSNPLIIAIFLGLAGSTSGIQSEVLNNALATIGKSAGGIAIFVLGIFLYDNFSIEAAKSAVRQSLFRMISLPLITWLLLIFSHESAEMNQFLFLQSGIPAAISIVVFAERYRYKLPQITGMVLLTSILSFVELFGLAFLAERIF